MRENMEKPIILKADDFDKFDSFLEKKQKPNNALKTLLTGPPYRFDKEKDNKL